MRIDMHIHSKYSISLFRTPSCSLDLKDIIKWARKKGLKGFAISDHDNIIANNRIKKIMPKDMVYINACEISSKHGHILAYGINEKIKKGLSYEETIEKIHSQGALAIAAHPYNVFNFYLRKKNTLKKFSGLEVFNSSTYGNKKALSMARELGCCMTAGSDSHIKSRIGNAYITLMDVESEDDVLNIIKKKKNSFTGTQDEPISTEIIQDFDVIKYVFKSKIISSTKLRS